MLTGGTMSGALTVQESVTFESSGSSKPVLTLKNTNADTTPPSLTFQKDSSSPAINDEIANINFYGDDDGGNVTAYANLKVISPDPSNGSEDGMMTIKTMAGGTLTDTLVLASGNATVSTINATTVDLGNWTISELGGVLYFKTSGTNKMKLDASGNLAVAGDVTAFHTF